MATDFFAGIEQQTAELAGTRAKTPVFYRSGRMFSLVFPAKLAELRRLLPDRRFRPATLVPGVGAVHVTAWEYYDCDIGPYNELAVGALLQSDEFAKLPGYNMTRQLLAGCMHTYILRLPVTTELALRAGIDLYNYPKLLTDIDFDDEDGLMGCRVAQDGAPIMRVRAEKLSTKPAGTMQYFCHLYQDRQPQSAEFKINAEAYGVSLRTGRASLELGTAHPLALELRRLLWSTRPLLSMYMPKLQGILYGPEHLSLALIARFLASALQVPMGGEASHPAAAPATARAARQR